MFKILVADDHSIVREGIIKSLSEGLPDAKFVEAGSASEILDLVNKEKWDLLILDINLPGRSGLEVLKETKGNIPKIPVIVLSMYPEDQFAIRVIKAGASAYLTKDTPSEEIVKAVKKVLNGEQYITPSITRLITSELRCEPTKSLHETLSNREYQVFLLIALGKNITDIAQELSLSAKTISVYRSSILQKMHLKNNSEITYYAFKYRLVE